METSLWKLRVGNHGSFLAEIRNRLAGTVSFFWRQKLMLAHDEWEGRPWRQTRTSFHCQTAYRNEDVRRRRVQWLRRGNPGLVQGGLPRSVGRVTGTGTGTSTGTTRPYTKSHGLRLRHNLATTHTFSKMHTAHHDPPHAVRRWWTTTSTS